MMTLRDSLNRTVNLLGTAIVGLAGIAFLPDAILETAWVDRLDDIFLLVLAFIGIVWYARVRNRFARSAFPIVLVALSLLVKFGGVIVEFKDMQAVGDDLGGLILFVLATLLVGFIYLRTGTFLKRAEGESAPPAAPPEEAPDAQANDAANSETR